MPEMDGFTFLEQMIKLPGGTDGPAKVVILTSSSSSADKARAGTYKNVISFLSKPLNEKRLIELRDLVRRA
jgi:CheY-like chemotaxis protein